MNVLNFNFCDFCGSGLNKNQLLDDQENQGQQICDYFISKQKKMMNCIDQVQHGLASRILEPIATGNDTNGSYFLSFFSDAGESKTHGVYKPSLQSRGAIDHSMAVRSRRGIPPGSQSFRERLAYALLEELYYDLVRLDVISFKKSIIPTTVLAEIEHEVFGQNHRIGSYQRFKRDRSSLDKASEKELEMVPLEEYFTLALIDCLSLNTDCHLGNILYAKDPNLEIATLTLIDHGECFPEILGLKEISLDWRYLPFARNPFPAPWIQLIDQLDVRRLAKRILTERDSANFKEKEKRTLTISGEAIGVFVYAVASLQYFVRRFPEKPIALYVEYLSKHSQFGAEIKDREVEGRTKIVRLSALTFPLAEEEFRSNYGDMENVQIRRRDFGGGFVNDCKSYWQDAKKFLFKGKQPSPQDVFASIDDLYSLAMKNQNSKIQGGFL